VFIILEEVDESVLKVKNCIGLTFINQMTDHSYNLLRSSDGVVRHSEELKIKCLRQ